MGFHIRHIDESLIRNTFSDGGAIKVAKLWSADAVVSQGELASKISDVLSTTMGKEEMLIEIEKLLTDADRILS